jgi:hypothetical protein
VVGARLRSLALICLAGAGCERSSAGPDAAVSVIPDATAERDAAGPADAPAAAPEASPDLSSPRDTGTAYDAPTAAVAVTVDRKTVRGRIGQDFLGLSFEKSHLTDDFFRPDHGPLVALFKLLGPRLLRIGANDVDRTTWQPDARPVAGGMIARTVGTAAVDALAAFLRATGWKVIYGVNLKTGTADNSAAEAKYVAAQLGPALAGFEIGNEINLGGLSYPEARAKWESFAAAIRAAAPDAPLIGPATNPGGLAGYLVPFAHDEADKIVLLTHHYYRGSGASAGSTMAKLLSPDPGLIRALKTLSMAATTNHVRDGFRLGETASFSSHGAPGVSDAFGAALWALDFFFDNAENGSGGINFHGGGTGMDGNRPFTYSPIAEQKSAVTGAHPIFYAMLLLSLAGTGDVVATTVSGATDLSAHALAASDGSLSVILVNKGAAAATVAVDVGSPVSTATAISLEAPSLMAQTGVTLAGAPISPAGAWAPGPPRPLPSAGPVVSLVVPAASVALVMLRF